MRDWTRQPLWPQESWANPEPIIKKDSRPFFLQSSETGSSSLVRSKRVRSELEAESPSILSAASAAGLGSVRWNDFGAIRMLLLQNDKRDATENSDGGQDESQGYGLTEKTDTT